MKLLNGKYDVNSFWLADRDFLFHPDRVLKFCESKRESDVASLPWATTSRVNQINDEIATSLRQSECIALCLGLESGSQRILDYLGKGTTVQQNIEAMSLLDRHRILSMGSFILGLPTQTEADIQANFDLLQRSRLHDGGVLMIMPVVGTKIFEELVSAGRIDPDDTATWQEISNMGGHENPRRNYSDVPFERFRKLYSDLANIMYSQCSSNRKILATEYGIEHHFVEL
jgi:radical SAM superfamily enzyme YgiQ (UPF0313 family)